jgi:hypothetical protein
MFLGSFFLDSDSSLAKVLTCFFSLILWRTVGGLLFELISLSLSFIGFCSFLRHAYSFPQTGAPRYAVDIQLHHNRFLAVAQVSRIHWPKFGFTGISHSFSSHSGM